MLPPLTHWENTRSSLHRAAQVLSVVRKHLVERQPNYLHLSLQVNPTGLTTGTTTAGEIRLNFTDSCLMVQGQRLSLQGQTQASLLNALLAILDQPLEIDRGQVSDPTPFEIDPQHAADYALVLHTVYTALKNFIDALPGKKSPPVVWGHGFDLSSLWFATEQADESAPHMNFGFSPRSPGLERPYFYTYAYPRPEGYSNLPLPAPARWQTEGWIGTVLEYDDLRQQSDPMAAMTGYYQHTYEVTAALLSGTRG